MEIKVKYPKRGGKIWRGKTKITIMFEDKIMFSLSDVEKIESFLKTLYVPNN